MNNFENIKCFVLDFGGVLYDISHKATFNAFYSLSNDKEKFNSYDMKEYLNDELIIQFEKGLITPGYFRKQVREKFSIVSDDNAFDKAFNATLIKMKDDSIKNVQELKNKGKVFLLSNTNEIHHGHFKEECRELFGLFDGIYFSYLLGARKPEQGIFDLLTQRTNIQPKYTLFIDDSIENIASAKSLGFLTYLVDDTHFLSDLIHIV